MQAVEKNISPLINHFIHNPRLEELPNELQSEIANLLDYPSRASLSWTCQHFFRLLNVDFDRFVFADRCAALGYRTLLEYSLKQGGPFDLKTSWVAAEYGQVDILDLFMAYHSERLPYKDWRSAAAFTGNTRTLRWVDSRDSEMCEVYEVAKVAAFGGHAQLAVEYYNRATNEPSEEIAPRQQEIYLEFAVGNHCQAALEFRRLQQDPMDDDFNFSMLKLGMRHRATNFIVWAVEVSSALLPNSDFLINIGVKLGNIRLLQLAKARGGDLTFTRSTLWLILRSQLDPTPESNYFAVLRYLHEVNGLTSAPFKLKLPLSLMRSETPAALSWMKEQSYPFDSDDLLNQFLNLTLQTQMTLDLLTWILNEGAQVTAFTIASGTYSFRPALLDKLWQAKPQDLLPDSTTISTFFRYINQVTIPSTFKDESPRFGFKPIKCIINWLLDHGYTWGDDREQYDQFVTLLKNRNVNATLLDQFIEDTGLPGDHPYAPTQTEISEEKD